MIEVLAENFNAAGSWRRPGWQPSPIRWLETLFDVERGLNYANRIFLDAEPEPFLSQANRDVVRQGIRAPTMGRLNMNFWRTCTDRTRFLEAKIWFAKRVLAGCAGCRSSEYVERVSRNRITYVEFFAVEVVDRVQA